MPGARRPRAVERRRRSHRLSPEGGRSTQGRAGSRPAFPGASTLNTRRNRRPCSVDGRSVPSAAYRRRGPAASSPAAATSTAPVREDESLRRASTLHGVRARVCRVDGAYRRRRRKAPWIRVACCVHRLQTPVTPREVRRRPAFTADIAVNAGNPADLRSRPALPSGPGLSSMAPHCHRRLGRAVLSSDGIGWFSGWRWADSNGACRSVWSDRSTLCRPPPPEGFPGVT